MESFRARVKVSFTLDSDIFEKFKAKCEKNDAAMSRVLEELMKQFNGPRPESGRN